MRDSGGVPSRVLATVISYNPGPDFETNLRALREQVESVVVVDNGSSHVGFVEDAVRRTGCRLISNSENLGIAAALNQAVKIARDGGFEWVATFDQDSLIEPGAVAGLLDLYRDHPEREGIGIMTMGHRDRVTGRDCYFPRDVIAETPEWRSLRTAITSGSVIRTEVFNQLGGFEEKLFIDCVDHEFCLRCRSHGLLVIEGRRQSMSHSLGETAVRKLGSIPIPVSNHSATRRYYITRNQLEVSTKYLLTDFSWSSRGLYHLAGGSIVTLAFESDKLRKLQAMFAGALDFALRRFGPRRPSRA